MNALPIYVKRKVDKDSIKDTSIPCLMEMPIFEISDTVGALRIKTIQLDRDLAREEDRLTDGTAIITFDDEDISDITLNKEYVDKYQPYAGGYYIIRSDGTETFFPASVFMKSILPTMDIEEETPIKKSKLKASDIIWGGFEQIIF